MLLRAVLLRVLILFFCVANIAQAQSGSLQGRLRVAGAGSVSLLHTLANEASLSIYDIAGESSRDYPVSGAPSAVALGDVNYDGLSDFVSIESECRYDGLIIAECAPATISTYLNSPSGEFQLVESARQLPFSCERAYPARFRFPGEFTTGIAVGCTYPNRLYLLQAQGDGTFQTVADYSMPYNVQDVQAYDLNRDGRDDVAVLSRKYFNALAPVPAKVVLVLSGPSGFVPSQIDVEDDAEAFNFADIDGDGDLDLIVLSSLYKKQGHLFQYGSVQAFRNDGSGGFSPLASHHVQVHEEECFIYYCFADPYVIDPRTMFVEDVHGDGHVDVFVGNSAYNSSDARELTRLTLGSDGELLERTQIPVTSFASDLATGDIDFDGYPEAVLSYFDGTYDFYAEYLSTSPQSAANGFPRSATRGINYGIARSYVFDTYGIANALIRVGGTPVAITNADGTFDFRDIPPGRYLLEFEHPRWEIDPVVADIAEDRVVLTPVAGRYVPPPPSGEGGAESSVIHTLWNGFLGMTNILELINPHEEPVEVQLKLRGIDGSVVHELSISLEGNSQRDLIVNDMPGFLADSYGIIQLETSAGIDGRLFYYRSDGGSDYEFAFGVPFAVPNYGSSAVGFNTFQPSTDESDAADTVFNWLSVVNLAPEPKSFTIAKYDQAGTLLEQSSLTVPAYGRVDVDGGHVSPGPSTVGLNRITADDESSPYIAQLTRYGSSRVASPKGGTAYRFAFPLSARQADRGAQQVPLSTRFGRSNWLEVVNMSQDLAEVSVTVYDSDGVAHLREFSLAGFAQRHISVNEFLAQDSVGYAKVDSASSALLVQSMHYLRNTSKGSILGMYGSESRTQVAETARGSYNLFLLMNNWLQVSNTSGTAASIEFALAGDSTARRTIELAPHASTEFPLHETSTYGTARSSYGQFQVTSSANSPILAELVRIRRDAAGLVDFAAPTAVR